jgi:ABC-2 type transport system ATP-binding protein
VRRRPIGQLSKGYRQRVGLAAALLHDPAVLVLDEPTVGLDPSQIESVRSLVRELAGDHTVLLSTHILPEVEATCDRVMIIARGRIRAAGTLDELRRTAAADNSYVLETDHAKAREAIEAIKEIERVDEIARDGEWIRYRVTAKAGAGDCREALARTLAERGAITRELGGETMSLEQLFLRLVEAREEAAA